MNTAQVIELIGWVQSSRSGEVPAGARVPGGPAMRAFVTTRADSVIVELHDHDGLSLVSQALEAARQFEPLSLFIEGPYVSFAVKPPVWYGRVRVVTATADMLDAVLPGAADAAVRWLRRAGLLPAV